MNARLVDPRSRMAPALLLALALALALMAAGAGDLGTLDLSLGGEGSVNGAPPAADGAAPAEPPAAAAPEPAWLADPLAPPFPELAGAR